jgi:hypothetical protein
MLTKKVKVIFLIMMILFQLVGCQNYYSMPDEEVNDNKSTVEIMTKEDLIIDMLTKSYREKTAPFWLEAINSVVGEWKVSRLKYRNIFGIEDTNLPEKEIVGKTVKIDNEYNFYCNDVELEIQNVQEVDSGYYYHTLRFLHGDESQELTNGTNTIIVSFKRNAKNLPNFSLIIGAYNRIYAFGNEQLNIGGFYEMEKIK